MYKITLFLLGAVFAVTLAEGQFYVPRAYYTIDAEGHESVKVPFRRLRRSLSPYPDAAGADSNANANARAEAYGGSAANAKANARAQAHNNGWDQQHPGSWDLPAGGYGASDPNLRAGMTRRTSGTVEGRSISASSSVGLDSSGHGYYDQSTSVH